MDRARLEKRALIDHGDAVAEREDLVEILRDDQHGGAGFGEIKQRLIDCRGRPRVHSPGRLADDQYARRLEDLTTDDEFLQVAAREAACPGSRPARPDIEPADHLAGEGARAAFVDEAVAHQPQPAIRAEESIFGERHLGDGAMAVALLGHEGGAVEAARCRAEMPDRHAVEQDRIGPGARRLAAQHRHQLGLTIAGDAADAEDLAAGQGEADILEIRAEPLFGAHAQILCYESRDARSGRLVALRRHERTADHELGEPLGGFAARVALGDDAAETHDRRPLAERRDLLELVTDVEDRAALGREAAQSDEQVLDLLRGQHRGWLVHDEELRILEETAYDLDALTLANREIVHGAIGMDGQSVARGGLGDAPLEVAPLPGIIDAERDVLGRGQSVEEGEVLKDDADAELAREGRVRDLHGPSLPQDLAGIRPQDAIDDLDQRRLAGAVLAEQRMNLARPHGELDRVIGKAAGEALDDALELKPWRVGRRSMTGFDHQ